jgi:glycosyltransferase involved in cell wall biosynthesis
MDGSAGAPSSGTPTLALVQSAEAELTPSRVVHPAASIVVIAYNERSRAPVCIRSVLAQKTESLFEVVFVDDGSTDGTVEAATDAAAGDKRFHLVRLPNNGGRGAARAAGVEAARGGAIAFVDADITLPPDWLERCLAELPGHAAVGGVAVPDGDATVLARVSGATPRVVPGRVPVTGNNVLFDRAAFASTGFDPRDRLGEDFRLAIRLQQSGHRLKRVPGLFVRHEESKSYLDAIRWRFDNGLDASTLWRELGIVRFADVVWIGWLGAWIIAIVAAVALSPWWLVVGLLASVAGGLAHANSRFQPRPVVPFLAVCVADVPVFTGYMLGRTVGIPRLLRGRR